MYAIQLPSMTNTILNFSILTDALSQPMFPLICGLHVWADKSFMTSWLCVDNMKRVVVGEPTHQLGEEINSCIVMMNMLTIFYGCLHVRSAQYIDVDCTVTYGWVWSSKLCEDRVKVFVVLQDAFDVN